MGGAVTIKRCATLNEAHILKGILDQNGIPAALGEEGYASIDWLAIPAINGIGLMVPSAHVEEAKTCILEAAEVGPTFLDVQFGEYELPNRYGRVSVWFLWFFHFGVVHAIIIGLTMVLNSIVPKKWIKIDPANAYVGPYYGSSGTIDWAEIADGVLLVFIIGYYFLLEGMSLRKAKDKDPEL